MDGEKNVSGMTRIAEDRGIITLETGWQGPSAKAFPQRVSGLQGSGASSLSSP